MYHVFHTETKVVHSHMPSSTSSQIQNGAVIPELVRVKITLRDKVERKI